MQTIATILTALLAFSATPLFAQEPSEAKAHLDPRPLAHAARISLTKAIRTALTLRPGTAVQAEIEGEVEGQSTRVFYEVMVVDKEGNPFEVLVDPETGAGEVKPAQEPTDEIAAFRAMAGKAKLSLESLVKRAAKLVRGRPIVAKLEMEDDAVAASMVFNVDSCDLCVELDAVTGGIMEIEATVVPSAGADEDEEENEGEEVADTERVKKAKKAAPHQRGKGTARETKEEGDERNEPEEPDQKPTTGKGKGKQAK